MNQVHDRQMQLQETMTLDGKKITLTKLRKIIKAAKGWNALSTICFCKADFRTQKYIDGTCADKYCYLRYDHEIKP